MLKKIKFTEKNILLLRIYIKFTAKRLKFTEKKSG
jgi:hypothetical protein